MTNTKLKPQPGSQKVSTRLHHLAANQPATTPPAALLPKPVEHDARLKRPLNSNRTGGPRTSEGRARSSLNAIKHGGYVTAKSAGEDYQQLLDELTERINPVGAVEVSVVESLAVELLRLSLLGKLEVERLKSTVSAEVRLTCQQLCASTSARSAGQAARGSHTRGACSGTRPWSSAHGSRLGWETSSTQTKRNAS